MNLSSGDPQPIISNVASLLNEQAMPSGYPLAGLSSHWNSIFESLTTPLFFQALCYWKILFSPSDFEPTSVRNCQFLTLPVRNCQHADPYQVLGLERSEQQCVLDTRRHQPTPTRCWGLNNLPEDFSNINCFHFTRCAENLACSKGSRDKLFSPKVWIGHFVLSLSFTGYMLSENESVDRLHAVWK